MKSIVVPDQVAERATVSTPWEMDQPPAPRREWRRWMRFNLKALLAVMALVAVYLGGRASMRPSWNVPPPGTWQLNGLAGHQRAVTLTTLPGSGLLLKGCGSLDGVYAWNAGKLTITKPNDKRFVGLAWKWDGDDLVLVAEPPSRPAGATYVGTRMRFISPDISTVAQAKVPTVPSTISIQLAKQRGGVNRLQNKVPSFRPSPWRELTLGEWQLTMPAGFQRAVNLTAEPNGVYRLTGAGVLDGTYEVKLAQLQAVAPIDQRMRGLAWAWEGDQLVLVTEPNPPPTGSSYIGARMKPVKSGE